jgi:hypothetical protein
MQSGVERGSGCITAFEAAKLWAMVLLLIGEGIRAS